LKRLIPSLCLRLFLWSDGLEVALIFFIICCSSLPIASAFQFNPDEGIELAKVALVTQGYALYTEIWNDQPPLFTLALAQWWQWWGSDILASRLLTLTCATLLVWTFYRCLRLSMPFGPAALIGTLGLCLTYDFLRLSVSVMRGLPAIGLALGAAYGLLVAQTTRRWQIPLLILSGIGFGLSLQTKLFTVVLLPAMVLQLLLPSVQRPSSHWGMRCSQLAVWLGITAITFWLVGVITHAIDVEQLLAPHASAQARAMLTEAPGWLFILLFLVQDLDCTLLAGVAVWLMIRPLARLTSVVYFPLFWLGSALLGLLIYQPIWSHYSPLIIIPLTWLATYTLSLIRVLKPTHWRLQINAETVSSRRLRQWLVGFVLFAIIAVPIKLALISQKMADFQQDSQAGVELLQQVQAYQTETRWLFTDLPILAFYSGLRVPPETVVFSQKRLAAGDLTQAELLKVLETYQPEQVVLGLYPEVRPLIEVELQRNYVPVYQRKQVIQYVRQSLSKRLAG
jgi:xanthosine utilization system XapX-like protein